MTKGIFLIKPDESLVELKETSYDSESILQELLAKYPNVLSGNQSEDEKPHRLLLIKREMGIPDGENYANRWSLDHLFLDQEGIPTLVEVKRSNDTRIRREVVGQMLDYAANAIVYWPIERIQAEIESIASKKNLDPDTFIQDFIGKDEDVIEFWQRVKNNLLSGRIRCVFVADEIPRELKRIVEFLNQQMTPADVFAIEVKQYVGQGLRSLVPIIVGVTADAEIRKSISLAKKQWDKDSFLEYLGERSNHRELEVAKQIIDWAENKNLRFSWGTGSSDGAFYAMLDVDELTHYTFSVRTGWKNAYIQLQFANLLKPYDSTEMRQELAKRIYTATGKKLSEDDLKKYPSIMLAGLNQEKLQSFLEVFDWYVEQCLGIK